MVGTKGNNFNKTQGSLTSPMLILGLVNIVSFPILTTQFSNPNLLLHFQNQQRREKTTD
jgi:hypothetical protein